MEQAVSVAPQLECLEGQTLPKKKKSIHVSTTEYAMHSEALVSKEAGLPFVKERQANELYHYIDCFCMLLKDFVYPVACITNIFVL